jgi:hypothetical protein
MFIASLLGVARQRVFLSPHAGRGSGEGTYPLDLGFAERALIRRALRGDLSRTRER